MIMSTVGNQRRAQRVGWFDFVVGKSSVPPGGGSVARAGRRRKRHLGPVSRRDERARHVRARPIRRSEEAAERQLRARLQRGVQSRPARSRIITIVRFLRRPIRWRSRFAREKWIRTTTELEGARSMKSGQRVGRRGFLKGAAASAAAGAAAIVGPVPVLDAQAPASSCTGRRRASTRDGTVAVGPRSWRLRPSRYPRDRRRRRADRRESRLRFHGRCAQVARLRIRRRQSRLEFPVAARIVHQLRRKQESRVADLLPRRIVGGDRRRVLQGRRQADGGHGPWHRRPAARGDEHLQRLRGARARVHHSWATRSTPTRGGPASNGITASRTRRRWSATTSSGTIRRFR